MILAGIIIITYLVLYHFNATGVTWINPHFIDAVSMILQRHQRANYNIQCSLSTVGDLTQSAVEIPLLQKSNTRCIDKRTDSRPILVELTIALLLPVVSTRVYQLIVYGGSLYCQHPLDRNHWDSTLLNTVYTSESILVNRVAWRTLKRAINSKHCIHHNHHERQWLV